MPDQIEDNKIKAEDIKSLKAFEVVLDDEFRQSCETNIVIAQDFTEALVIAHEMNNAINEIMDELEIPNLKVKKIEEMISVVAPSMGFSVENWIASIRKAMEANEANMEEE